MAPLLYDHPLFSYARKVKIALREKGVPFRAELPGGFGTGRRDGPFAEAPPRGEVPALVDGDLAIFESTVILEQVEERWPEPPLPPRDPAGRARARMVEEVCDARYEAINWGFGEIPRFRRATGALADQMRATAARHTRAMQDWLAARLGDAPWFGGERFGWVDAAAARMAAASDLHATGGRRRECRDHRLDWTIRSGGPPIVEAGIRDRTVRFSWPDAEG